MFSMWIPVDVRSMKFMRSSWQNCNGFSKNTKAAEASDLMLHHEMLFVLPKSVWNCKPKASKMHNCDWGLEVAEPIAGVLRRNRTRVREQTALFGGRASSSIGDTRPGAIVISISCKDNPGSSTNTSLHLLYSSEVKESQRIELRGGSMKTMDACC